MHAFPSSELRTQSGECGIQSTVVFAENYAVPLHRQIDLQCPGNAGRMMSQSLGVGMFGAGVTSKERLVLHRQHHAGMFLYCCSNK
eukprot:1061233-Amphidinium_carterae.2